MDWFQKKKDDEIKGLIDDKVVPSRIPVFQFITFLDYKQKRERCVTI